MVRTVAISFGRGYAEHGLIRDAERMNLYCVRCLIAKYVPGMWLTIAGTQRPVHELGIIDCQEGTSRRRDY